MRFALLLATLPLPAFAWEFSADPICTLTHQTEQAEIAITFDANLPEYALFITLRDGTWDTAPSFEMAFSGGVPISIGTTRHGRSADGATLTVRDRGFGNVLDGIEFNRALRAVSGTRSVVAQTETAAPAVQAFRACPSDVPALS